MLAITAHGTVIVPRAPTIQAAIDCPKQPQSFLGRHPNIDPDDCRHNGNDDPAVNWLH